VICIVPFFLPSLGHEGDEGDEGQEVDEEGHEGALDYSFKNINCIGPKKSHASEPSHGLNDFFHALAKIERMRYSVF